MLRRCCHSQWCNRMNQKSCLKDAMVTAAIAKEMGNPNWKAVFYHLANELPESHPDKLILLDLWSVCTEALLKKATK